MKFFIFWSYILCDYLCLTYRHLAVSITFQYILAINVVVVILSLNVGTFNFFKLFTYLFETAHACSHEREKIERKT